MINNFFKKYILSIWLVLFAILIMVPAYSQDFNEDKPIPEDAIMYMERTQCYGTCPVYSYYVFEDGTAQYQGKEYVEKMGSFYTSLSQEQIEALINLFHQYEFFNFEDRYYEMISDLPTTYLYFSHDGNAKKITDYYGAPESLKKLEKEVDKFMQSLNWEQAVD